jgi:U3 small nucleolar RNA-associated protein 21
VYSGHSGSIVQLLVLGDQLLSLGKDGQLLVWKIGEYDSPQVRLS